jgi:hypothetical protein
MPSPSSPAVTSKKLFVWFIGKTSDMLVRRLAIRQIAKHQIPAVKSIDPMNFIERCIFATSTNWHFHAVTIFGLSMKCADPLGGVDSSTPPKNVSYRGDQTTFSRPESYRL